MRSYIIGLTALATASLGTTGAAAPAAAQAAASPLTAQLTASDGARAGTVRFEQVEHGVVITARLENLPVGPHGFHIHEKGECEPPDFQSAGGHYNPTGAKHGFDAPDGYHAGDLPNVYVAADGTATADFFAPQLTLRGGPRSPEGRPFTLIDEDGSAIMVHRQIDDYRNEPPGSSGDRIACGVIAPPAG